MKIIKTLLLTITLLLLTSCGNKMSFKTQDPLENAALVYIYSSVHITSDDATSDPEYSIRINNKPYMQRIKEGEYIVINLKPQAMSISATKKQVQEKVLNMDLKNGQIYYLKIKTLEGGAFDFNQVNNSVALNEITKTGLAGSSVESAENIITEFVNPKETESFEVKATSAPTVAPVAVSKTEEIMRAHALKEKGIISDEEFKILKANILEK